MKVVNAFINIFSILVFLTLGSFLIIVALHIVSQDDAMRALTELYTDPLRSLQAGLVGFLFVFVGLSFAKFIVKTTRSEDALVLEGENGTITVSIYAIEDLIRKCLRKFDAVKDFRLKTTIRSRDLSLKLKLTLWSGCLVPEVVKQIEEEVRLRLQKILGITERVEVSTSVRKVVLSDRKVQTAESAA